MYKSFQKNYATSGTPVTRPTPLTRPSLKSILIPGRTYSGRCLNSNLTLALLPGRRGRWRWLGSVCVGFLLVVFVLGRRILGLFGPEFVDGYPALCIIAVATCVWTMASLAPSFLKYVSRQGFVVVATALAVLTHVGLCFPLGYYYGATGAAISYAIPVIALYLTMAIVASRELQKLKD